MSASKSPTEGNPDCRCHPLRARTPASSRPSSSPDAALRTRDRDHPVRGLDPRRPPVEVRTRVDLLDARVRDAWRVRGGAYHGGRHPLDGVPRELPQVRGDRCGLIRDRHVLDDAGLEYAHAGFRVPDLPERHLYGIGG